MESLDNEEIEGVLTENGLGVLSLVDGKKPYGIPISFGYGDGAISFMMQSEPTFESRKLATMETNPNACLTVYDDRTEPNRVWRSVLVSGELYEIPEDEEDEAFFALADNAVFAPEFDVLDVPAESIDLRFVGLSIDEISGRKYVPPKP